MERRNFLKTSCKICVLGVVGLSVLNIESCGPVLPIFKTQVLNKQILVPLSIFDDGVVHIIQPKGWYYEIAVQKTGQDFLAILLQCTHQDNELTVNGNNGYHCSTHGSLFSKEGMVIKGPAEKPLQRYATQIKDTMLVINV